MAQEQAKGSQSQCLLDFETVYGSDPGAPNGRIMPFAYPLDLGGEEPLKPSEIHRTDRNPAQPSYDNHDVKGSIVVPVDQVAFGYWLKLLLGPPQTSGVGPYTHVFKSGAELPSGVIEKGFTDIDQYFKYNGVKAGKMSLEVAGKGGDLTAKVELLGAKETLSGTSYDGTPTTLTLSKFQHRQATLKEGGSTIATVRSLTLEIDNQLDGDTFVIADGGIRGALNEGDCPVSGKLTAMFGNATLYNKAVNGTESSLELTLTSGAYSLVLKVPELLYSRKSPSIVKGGVWVEMDFQGYYENDAEAAALVATLINNYASYA